MSWEPEPELLLRQAGAAELWPPWSKDRRCGDSEARQSQTQRLELVVI